MEVVNTNFKVIGLTRLRIKPKSTVPEADALTARPSKLLNSIRKFRLELGAGNGENCKELSAHRIAQFVLLSFLPFDNSNIVIFLKESNDLSTSYDLP